MGKRFHKNSIYILILRTSILTMDIIGINVIFGLLLNFFEYQNHPISSQIPPFQLNLQLSALWILTSLYFKTYKGNLKIAYNLGNSIKQLIIEILIMALITQLFNFHFFNAIFYICFFILAIIYLPVIRYIVAFYLNKIDNIIPIRKRVTIVGTNPLKSQLQEFLEAEHSGYRLIKLNLNRKDYNSNFDFLKKIILLANQEKISYIYTFINVIDESDIQTLDTISEKNFIKIRYIKDYRSAEVKAPIINKESDIPFKETTKIPLEDLDNRIRKRLFDLFLSSLVIVFILSWLWPIIALIIKFDSRGPVLFKQLRTGRNNLPFVCYKFRTMVLNKHSDCRQAVPNDYRFTRFGKLLRKTNLDELPQFINVLKGEMSIIGPRPHMLNHSNEYMDIVESYNSRHFIKPGISGWAQINGLRGSLDKKMMEVRVQYDLDYIRNWNFWVDLDIVFKTIILTFSGDENAY